MTIGSDQCRLIKQLNTVLEQSEKHCLLRLGCLASIFITFGMTFLLYIIYNTRKNSFNLVSEKIDTQQKVINNCKISVKIGSHLNWRKNKCFQIYILAVSDRLILMHIFRYSHSMHFLIASSLDKIGRKYSRPQEMFD